MNVALTLVLILPACVLIAAVLLPDSLSNSRVRLFRKLITRIAGIQFLIAFPMAIAQALGMLSTPGPISDVTTMSSPLAGWIYYDGVSSLMLSLVSFVGWIICRYSIRYLDGEPTQGQYYRWTAFTIGSVSMMVISGNLLMFVGCWVMTSLGLHRLLLHYGHRPAAQRAAWTKFTISRIGDAALLAALAILFSEFGTLGLAELFAAVESLPAGATAATQFAGLLLVAGAVTKSAQVPFHTWLPQTMETPTPVSALMHAGVVNAGGYLIIRTSPLVSLTPLALSLLAVIGAVTACFAAVVMLTQTSIKKSLAYSTIAQMGFMMLQCGLGAFSAAMLHILAHSLYKAHAFLSSGSVISQRAATNLSDPSGNSIAWTKQVAIGAIVVAMLGITMTAFGIDPANKPGGVLLGGILGLALTHWLCQVMRIGNHKLLIRSIAVAALLCVVYVASFLLVDTMVASSLPQATPTQLWPVALLIAALFAAMFVLQTQLSNPAQPSGMSGRRVRNAFYIHAANGFYVESVLRRIFGPLASN